MDRSVGALGRQRFRLRSDTLIGFILISAAAIAIFFALEQQDFFEQFHQFSREWEEWQLDEWFTVFVVASPASLLMLMLYARELKHEVARRRRAEASAVNLANFDPLTGLANRRLFNEEFARRLDAARHRSTGLSVVMLDLDNFKEVNDLYGHGVGDRLLQDLADRLRSSVRPDGFVARLGGDEFAILRSGDTDGAATIRLVELLLMEIEGRTLHIEGVEVAVTGSIGIATYPRDGHTTGTLLQRSDVAMYQAKASGRNKYAFYDSVLDSTFRDRLKIAGELRQALQSGEILPYYQPLVDLATGTPIGFEVLARWHHPSRGVLAGGVFVPVAEASGLMGLLLDAVLHRACTEAASWPKPLIVAINVSPIQFSDPELVAKVVTALQQSGLAPQRLEIEITEAALVQDFQVAGSVIKSLRKMGVRVSLDDFGTGYSSLRHLHELTLDKIKIDGSFVRGISGQSHSEIIVSSMIELAHGLGMEVTGEGIEEGEDARWLVDRGCDQGQGYLFSKAVPANEVAGLINSANYKTALSSQVVPQTGCTRRS